MTKSSTAASHTTSLKRSATTLRSADNAVDIVSDTRSRNPTARISPNDSRRERTHPRTPFGTRARASQICSNAASNAANTVVEPMRSVTTLSTVATVPPGLWELSIALRRMLAVPAPNKEVSW